MADPAAEAGRSFCLSWSFCAVLLSVVLDHPPLSGAAKRVFHIGTYALLIGAIATGRIRSENLVRGIRIGLALGFVSGLAGLAGVGYFDKYSGRLTGVFADPNVASLVAVGLGMVAMNFARTSRERWSLAVADGADRRALPLAHGRPRPRPCFRLVPLGTPGPSFSGRRARCRRSRRRDQVAANLQTAGPFSIHSQSSGLRNLINQASNHQVAQHYPHGHGCRHGFHQNLERDAVLLPQQLCRDDCRIWSSDDPDHGSSPSWFTAISLWRSRPRAPALEAALACGPRVGSDSGRGDIHVHRGDRRWRSPGDMSSLPEKVIAAMGLEIAETEPSTFSTPGQDRPPAG